MQEQKLDTCSDTGRRRWLVGAIYSLTSLIGGTFAASVSTYLLGKPKLKDSSWTDVTKISDLQPGIPQQISFQQSREDGWILRNEKASAWITVDQHKVVTAFSPLCTHLGCAYHWQAERQGFACPCHGSIFSAAGDVLAGPASRPLDRYRVKVESGRVWLGPIEPSKGT